MQRLNTFSQSEQAAALQGRLEAAGIRATVTTELANFLGLTNFVVWVDDQADFRAVESITASFAGDMATENSPASRVDLEDESTHLCRKCKYNLRGQTADGLCPECAHPYRLITTRTCPKCNTEGPSDFDLCWKCGTPL